MDSNPMAKVKAKKSKANLNKPFEDVSAILNEIKDFQLQSIPVLYNDLWLSS